MITLHWKKVDGLEQLNEQMLTFMTALRRYSPALLLEFFQDNVAASQADVALGMGLGAVDEYVMPRAGHVIGIAVSSNAARTAGTLNVYPTIDGTQHADSVQLDATNTEVHSVKIGKNLDSAFEAGALIGAEIDTDGSWAPTTADITVSVLIQLSMED